MLSTLLRAAQREHLVTVESIRCALLDAGCAHTSTGHVHALIHGKVEASAAEWSAVMAHLTPDGIARAAAAVCGLSVVAGGARSTSLVSAAMQAGCAASQAALEAHAAMSDGTLTRGESARVRDALVSAREHVASALLTLDSEVVQ